MTPSQSYATPPATAADAVDAAIAKVVFLRDGTPDDRAALRALMICHTYRRGNVLFYHGDPCTAIYVVLDGRVKLSLMSEEGREVILKVVGPAEVFGIVAALDAGPHLGNAITLSDAMLGAVPIDRFLAWFERRPHLHRRVLAELAGMVRRSHEKLGEQALLPVKKRLHATLLEIAREQGQPIRGDEVVFERPTHQELAERVGSTRVVISRILKELLDEVDDLTADGRVIRLPLNALVVPDEF